MDPPDLDDHDALLLFADGRVAHVRLPIVVPVLRIFERWPRVPEVQHREFVIASGPQPYLFEEVE